MLNNKESLPQVLKGLVTAERQQRSLDSKIRGIWGSYTLLIETSGQERRFKDPYGEGRKFKMVAVGFERKNGASGVVILNKAIPEEETFDPFDLTKAPIIVDAFFLPVQGTVKAQSLLLYGGEEASKSRVLKLDPEEIADRVSLEEIFQNRRPDSFEEELEEFQKGRPLTPKDIYDYSELVEWCK